jgi:hypothetical protein
MLRVRAPKDFWAGALFIAIGTTGGLLAQDYAFGSALQMGPGYLPRVLSWATAAIGLLVLLRSFAIDGPSLTGFRPWPFFTVLASVVLFALTIERFGLVLATLVTTLVGGLGSRDMSLSERVLVSVGLAIFCALVFVYALGQPMTLWPS